MVRAAQAVIVSVLRSKGSDRSGKIGGLEQDSNLAHDWKIGFKIHFRRIELSRLTVLLARSRLVYSVRKQVLATKL
jgi:hypothetical protein